ncbi:MAG: tRNA (guanosine(46)-N7)-methyltransferase TrmB [Synergistaceae bacterium]|jgi:tRNA (guanine-N7-)-methyltransferase|nr:tRNA (guanosine(46)-N7)-methyltransferase TrmB [Synergistaceae bacterium]
MTVNYDNILFPNDFETLPVDFSRFSTGLSRLELEIGFGNGEYTVRHAAAHPEMLLVGIEVSPACIARCVRRIGLLPNVKIIRTDARFMMKELFPDESLNRVCMNFPCPWPRKRHASRRVTAGGFVDDIAAVLKIGGVFEMVTDEEWYAREVRKIFGEHEALSAADCELLSAPRPVTTKYERKWLEMGKNIFRLNIVKEKNFTVKRRTWGFKKGESDVMHVKTGSPLPEDLPEKLSGVSGAQGEARWVFKKLFHGARAEPIHWLVETISSDAGFEQRYYLLVSARGNDVLVRPDGTSNVYLTPAVRCSIEDLGRRLR